MRSTLLTSGGLHLDTGALDLGLTKAVVQDFLAGQEEDTRHFIHTLPNLIGTFQHTSGPVLRNKNRSPARTFECRPGQSPALGEGHVGLLGSVGALTPPCKQMGGEGILVKSKSLFGHGNKSMGKMDPVVSNGSKQPREADDVRGAVGLGELLGGLPLPSPEPCPEGKRRNVRKGPNHGAAQTNCIRQILLLQLELIEQQQQQLQSKNHEIDELKAEKDMLIARIDRMEQRLQQTVKKASPRTSSTATRRKEPESLSETGEGPGLSQRGLHTPKQTCFGRGGKGHKRRFLCQELRVGRSRRGGGPRSPPQRVVVFKEEEDEGAYNENEEEEGTEREAFGLQSSPNTGEDAASAKLMQELPYLATTDMYLCCWQPPPTSSSPWRDPSPTQEDMVDVPSWRENTVAPLEEKEAANIPESLEDKVFRKRHIKLELEEKRRKRWDIQRIREQRIFQRLQQRMNKKKAIPEPEPLLLSFYPEAEDVESIMITPFLPVAAFGRPLPNVKPQNFELPWLDERERVRSRPEVSVKNKKKTPHRMCRK